MTNSRAKGARGEREAAKYLRSIGFEDAVRGQQRSGIDQSDVICPDSLPDVHFEVKFGYPISTFDIDKSLWRKAVDQAINDSGGKKPLLLWKPLGRSQWRLTYDLSDFPVTVSGWQVERYIIQERADD